ncbi:MAG: ABC transporter permease [Bacteroidales bacterium]|nr:ABC transporter permease [Bacteroidales bacterium]
MSINAKMAFHSLTRSKGRVFTRILSLTLGLTLGVLLLSYVHNRYNFDNFLPNHERLYKVFVNYGKEGGGTEDRTFSPLAHSLMRDCPEVEASARLFGSMTMSWSDAADKEHELTVYGVDTLFFDVLDFGLMRGSKSDLREFGNIFLSEEAAERIFGNEDPMGKTLKDNLGYEKRVAGIFKEVPYNTSLGKFDALVNVGWYQTSYDKESCWEASNEYTTYVKLRQGATKQTVEAWMNGRMIEKYGLGEMQQKFEMKFMMVPIIRAEVMVGTRKMYMDFIAAITILVLILCALNYALLSISSLVNRSRTIAVMRCTAAEKKDIWIQFMYETLFVMLASGVLCVLITYLLSDTLVNATETPILSLFSPKNLWVSISVVLVLFLGSGMIPATLFANVSTAVAFRGMTDKKKGWKQALLFFEVICVSFSFAFMLVSVRQINMMQDGQLGYNPKNMVYIDPLVHGGDDLFNIERSFEALPCVDKAGSAWSLPCWGYAPNNPYVDEKTNEVTFPFVIEMVSDSYFDVMEMKMLEGRVFNESSALQDVVVNTRFLELAGIQDNPIGRTVLHGDKEGNIQHRFNIIGVVDNIRSTESGRFQPMVFGSIRYNLSNEDWQYGGFHLMLRLNEMGQENIAMVEKKYRDQYQSINNYQLNIYEDVFSFKMKGEFAFRNLLMIVASIASLIAAIGLVGYIGDELKRRQKEIAIRKLCGSEVSGIIRMMIRDFSVLAVPAILVGEVLAYIAADKWLEMFEYRLPLDLWMFVGTGLIVLFAIYIIEVLLTIKIANTNPVESLKTD